MGKSATSHNEPAATAGIRCCLVSPRIWQRFSRIRGSHHLVKHNYSRQPYLEVRRGHHYRL